MRKHLLLLAALFCIQSVVCAPVSQKQAQKQATQFFSSRGITSIGNVSPVETPETRANGQAPWYAYNAGKNKGFVIISGDDRAVPVLGYSTTGSFSWSSAPEGLKDLLQGYAEEIEWIQKNNVNITKATSTRASSDRNVISPMLQTRWNQGSPYNNACPNFFSNERSVTGCVATAMAQVLYYQYQQYPDKMVKETQAEIPAYQCSTNWRGYGRISVSAIPAGTAIDWSNMLPTYASGASDDQLNAVANLMAMCGASVKMDYRDNRNGGSSASVMSVPQALVNYFGFDESTRYASRSDYSLADWNDLIYNELANGRVVLYGGQSRAGSGHAFVINGYEGDNYFDVNWGWGGMSDGAFLLSVLAPSSTGIGGGTATGGYNMDMSAVINAEPSHNGTKSLGITTRNLSISDNIISLNFANSGLSEGTFDLGFASLNDDGTVTLLNNVTLRLGAVNGSRYEYYTLKYNAANITADGEYRIVAVARRSGDTEWQSLWSSERYLLVTVEGGNVTSIKEMPTNNLTATDMTAGAARATYKLLNVSATINNTGDDRFEGPIYLFASTNEDKGEAVATWSVAIAGRSSANISISWMPETAGTYTLWLCDDNNGQNVLASITGIVIENGEDSRTRIVLTSLNVNNAETQTENTDDDGRSVMHVIGNTIAGTYSIRALAAVDADLYTSLWRYDTAHGSYVEIPRIVGGTRQYNWYILQGSQGAEWSFDFSYDNLSDGKYMLKMAVGTFNTRIYKINPEIWSDDTHCFTIDYATGIKNIKTSNEYVSVYNLQGVRLGHVKSEEVSKYVDSLPSGIYIVNGKKISVK